MSDDVEWEDMLATLDTRGDVTLGDNLGSAQNCSAYPDPDLPLVCGEPATKHVIWAGSAVLETSFACDRHVSDALTHFKTHGAHAVSEYCAQPGAVYVLELDICVPGDGLAKAMAETADLQATLDRDRMDTTGA